MATPDYTLVRLDDDIADGALLTYDAKTDLITDSGITAAQGELQAAAGTVSVGLQDMSSAGEQVIWRNRDSEVNYAPPWHVIDEVNPGGSYDRYYGPMTTEVVEPGRLDILENPVTDVYVPRDEMVFRLNITFPESHNNVEFLVTHNGFEMWREIRDVNIGTNDIIWDMPIAFKTGSYEFSIKPYGDVNNQPPVKVMGDAGTNKIGHTVTYRAFTEHKLATEEYVVSQGTGGGIAPDDIMTKTVYDTTNAGKVDNAIHADKATTVDGGPSAGNDQYYGKDSKGVLGFHAISGSPSIPTSSDKVYVHEFTTAYTLGASELVTDRVPYYLYIGTGDSTFTLPHLGNLTDPEPRIFGIANHSPDKLDVNVRSGDSWNGDSTIKGYRMTPKTGIIVVTDVAQTSWYVVATMDLGHISEFYSKLQILDNELVKHNTAIEAHGVQLAQHASQIKGADSTANSALTLAQQNAETIVTNRKNAIKGVSIEQDIVHKTITLKFIADSGVIDTGVIDLTGWFDGGGTSPSQDHKIYYGFASRMPVSETDIIRLGHPKTVPTVAGLDIDIQRSSQASSYIYVWLPDSVGSIKGFTFSGFLSTWGSTALTIAGSPGKLYSSPNKTSATHVTFEVTQ